MFYHPFGHGLTNAVFGARHHQIAHLQFVYRRPAFFCFYQGALHKVAHAGGEGVFCDALVIQFVHIVSRNCELWIFGLGKWPEGGLSDAVFFRRPACGVRPSEKGRKALLQGRDVAFLTYLPFSDGLLSHCQLRDRKSVV